MRDDGHVGLRIIRRKVQWVEDHSDVFDHRQPVQVGGATARPTTNTLNFLDVIRRKSGSICMQKNRIASQFGR